MRREERVRRIPPPSIASLLTALCLVVVFALTGCTADSLTGPVLDPEITLQVDVDGDQGDEHNKNAFDGDQGDEHNNALDGDQGDEHNNLVCDGDPEQGDEHNCP